MDQDPGHLEGKRVLVTGAAGTVGRHLVERLAASDVAELIAVDNNETEVFFLQEAFANRNGFQAFVADIRDAARMARLMQRIDVVFHGAALKHVSICERSPFEAVKTNIEGVENVINAALGNDIEKVVFMSSDKAVNPTNVLGTSKLMGERLITAANSLKRKNRTVFASTRFGNVLGSRGSVLPVFYRQIRTGGPVTLTSPAMTRFVMTPEQAVDLVLESARIARGGEVLVTKMPTVGIADLAEVMVEMLAPRFGHRPESIEVTIVGVKPGEKMYEELLSEEEVHRSVELPHLFAVLPAFRALYTQIEYDYPDLVSPDVSRPYRSDMETPMPREELRAFLEEHQLLNRLAA